MRFKYKGYSIATEKVGKNEYIVYVNDYTPMKTRAKDVKQLEKGIKENIIDSLIFGELEYKKKAYVLNMKKHNQRMVQHMLGYKV